ncbi:hypothetical protein [Herbaspirillum sp.]|uniref:lipopolysaccharide biosynthesis protein n=1 Tax=Herbaspirillum sp. TaxID=1890675 RepID=UPI0031D4D7E2
MAERTAPELSGKRLLLHSLASLIDQALLSGLNFALGLVLIRLASKESYGLYSQMYVAGIFAATVLESLITGPLTTIAPGQSESQRTHLVACLRRFQLQLSGLLAILFGIASMAVGRYAGVTESLPALGIAFAVYVFANALREYQRSLHFIEGRPRRVLRIDLAYALAVAAGVALLVATGCFTVPGILLVLGLANAVGFWRSGQPRPATPSAPERRAAIAEMWQRGRWALPGALVAWATNYSYLYLAAASLGVAASAELNASRLLLMPISLSVMAWSRIARPMASRLFAARDWKHLDRLAWISVAGVEAVTLLYVGVLWLALPWLETHVLGAKYQGVEPMVLAWGAYFAINAARWIGSSWLTSNDQYRLLLISGIACLAVMLVSAALFIPRYGAWGAILALIVVEVFDFILIWAVFLPRTRRQANRNANAAGA